MDPNGFPRLTPESLAELREALGRKLEELTARDAEDPRAEQVVLVIAGLPLAPRSTDTDPDIAASTAAQGEGGAP